MIKFIKEELKLIYDALAIRTALVNDELKSHHSEKYQMFEDIKMKIKEVIE